MANAHKVEFMSIKDVIKETTFSRSTIYRMMDKGVFPRQISIGNNKVIWIRHDIENWMKEKVSSRSKK